MTTKFHYEVVPGFFLQNEPTTDPESFDYTKVNFGLIKRDYETDKVIDPDHIKSQWQRFAYYVKTLNNTAAASTQYKILFLARHGQGYHNVAERLYGTPAWNKYWSKLNGDGTMSWRDAQLTAEGEQQAREAHDFWLSQFEHEHIPHPQSYYVSPLDRCLATGHITFSTLPLPAPHPYRPVVKELLRERLGVHTCDSRSSRTCIAEKYTEARFEDGFIENDELWTPRWRETRAEITSRLGKLLDDVFTNDQHTFISFSSHSGSISAILRVIGHRKFSLYTGAVLPVFIKATDST